MPIPATSSPCVKRMQASLISRDLRASGFRAGCRPHRWLPSQLQGPCLLILGFQKSEGSCDSNRKQHPSNPSSAYCRHSWLQIEKSFSKLNKLNASCHRRRERVIPAHRSTAVKEACFKLQGGHASARRANGQLTASCRGVTHEPCIARWAGPGLGNAGLRATVSIVF